MKGYFLKVSAHFMRSSCPDFCQTCRKLTKNDENHEKIENLKIIQESFGQLPQASGNHFKWCEALFEKIRCRKFALILEKPKTGQNLPTPLSWDVELFSRGFESGDFPKDPFS